MILLPAIPLAAVVGSAVIAVVCVYALVAIMLALGARR